MFPALLLLIAPVRWFIALPRGLALGVINDVEQ